MNIKTNWLHLFVPDKTVPTARKAKAIRAFNRQSRNLQTHVTLGSFLTLNVAIKTLRDWWRLRSAWKSCRQVLKANPGGQKFLPLMTHDWKSSFLGKDAMSNLLTLNLFEEALVQLPRQKKGVFLQENQGWEYGFIHAWRNVGHEELIGFPHSSVRFWDFRYSFDESYSQDNSHYAVPIPDYIIANGPAADQGLRSAGYPPSMLVQAEALRYIFLDNFERANLSKETNVSFDVLIVGDYSSHHTYQQLRLLEQSFTH